MAQDPEQTLQPAHPSNSRGNVQPSSAAPRRPLCRLVLLALLARLLVGSLPFPFACLGLGIAVSLLVLGLATQRSRMRDLGAHASLFFAFVLALLSGNPIEADSSLAFDGERVCSGGEGIAEVLEPGSLADGDRVLLEPGSQARRAARGPAAAPSSPPVKTRVVLPDECVRVKSEHSLLAQTTGRLRRELGRARSTWLERTQSLGDSRTRTLVQSLVFGETSALDFELADLFTRTGTRHLLAVSGLHVSLVLLFAIGPLSQLLTCWLPRRWRPGTRALVRDLVRLVALGALVYLAGARAPALRAASAFAFAQAGGHLPRRASGDYGASIAVTRRADTLSVWSLALLCECLAAGPAPLSVSVRLSYGATLGLILGTRPITRALDRLLGRATSLPTGNVHGAWVRIPARRLGRLFVSGCGASIAATLFTLPFVWLEFGEWSPVGILATPLVMPLFVLVLILSWTWIVLPLGWIESALDGSIELLLHGLALADHVPLTPYLLPGRPGWWLAAWGLPLVFALRPHTSGRESSVALRLAGCVLALGLLPWSSEPETAELHLLDVGHGTAACLRVPGEPCWVFDAGSRDRARVARDALFPLLASWETSRVRVALSHSDLDHCSALRMLATRIPIDLWAGAPAEECGLRLGANVPRLDLQRGRVRLPTSPSSGLSIELSRRGSIPGNEGSRSLLLQQGASRVLLCGDAEGGAVRDLANRLEHEEPLTLLLLPHHGSDGPNFGRLLDAARPEQVWISHSRPLRIAGELERRGLAWHSTARDGPLLWRFD